MNNGVIEVICGTMYSGKTEELIRRVRRAIFAKQKVQVFVSHRNIRYLENYYALSLNELVAAIPVSNSLSINLLDMIDKTANVIAIDEIQFFDEGIVHICENLADEGIRVIVAGLTLNFRGEPFAGPMLTLLAKADILTKLTAICVVCGLPATHTQRLVNGEVAKWDDPIIQIGGTDVYQAVCRKHHKINKP